MRAKRLIPRIEAERLRSLRKRYIGTSEQLHAKWLTRAHPVTTTLRFACDHIAALGQARDEMERKA